VYSKREERISIRPKKEKGDSLKADEN